MAVPIGRFFFTRRLAVCARRQVNAAGSCGYREIIRPARLIGEVWTAPAKECSRIHRRPGADGQRQAGTDGRRKNYLGGQ